MLVEKSKERRRRIPYPNRVKGLHGEVQVSRWVGELDNGLKEHRIEDPGVDVLSDHYAVEVWNWHPHSYPSRNRLMGVVRSLSEYPDKIRALVFFQGELTAKEVIYLRSCGIRPILISEKPFSSAVGNPFLLNVDVDTIYSNDYDRGTPAYPFDVELASLTLLPAFRALIARLLDLREEKRETGR